jgi:hypothetical protein
MVFICNYMFLKQLIPQHAALGILKDARLLCGKCIFTIEETLRLGYEPDRTIRAPLDAPVAQLDRVLDSDSKGHRFESCRVRHFS